MKDIFIASLCHKGILGGALYFDEKSVTYRTNKLTVASEYRNLKMTITDMVYVNTGWLLLLPTVSIHFKNGTIYKFVVFSKKKFLQRLNDFGITER